MKYLLLPLVLLWIVRDLRAQSLTLADLEYQFAQKNRDLIAAKFNVDKAAAAIIQEKLWPNPSLSISEINLWKTYNIEEQAPLWGNFGKSQQIAVELEQIIETAGKRRKRIRLLQLEQQSASLMYEELLRDLRKELRLAFYQLQRANKELTLLNEVIELYKQLTGQFQKQSELKNLPLTEFYRIQSEWLSLQKEQIELENERGEVLRQLRIYTHNPGLQISDIIFPEVTCDYSQRIPAYLPETALQNNLGLKQVLVDQSKASQRLVIEKAMRNPDLGLQINYDRGGNIMHDFVGAGIRFDLPVFNRNKGNIKAAEINMQQQHAMYEGLQNSLTQSVQQLQTNLFRIEKTIKDWPIAASEQQKQTLEKYKKHLQNRQVTVLEFIDFTKAYCDSRKAYFQLQQSYLNTYEELKYIAGQDF